MKDTVIDILQRMRPHLEASGASLEFYFIDEDFGTVELLSRTLPGSSDENIRSIQHSVEQMIVQKTEGIKKVVFLQETPPPSERVSQREVPDLAEGELTPLRSGTGLALEMLMSLEQTLRGDAADRTLREGRQAEHFLNGPYPKWAADAHERYKAMGPEGAPKEVLLRLREIFPAIERTTRALARVAEAERAAWQNSEVELRSNTPPRFLQADAAEDYTDIQQILTELRPHLGDRTLGDFDEGTASEAERESSRPTTHLLDRIFRDASRQMVRDVYLEAGESSATLCYRVGREIQPIVEFPRTLYRSLIARIKHLASLDITERKRRQEGLISFPDSSGYKGLSVHVQTIPDHFAERIRLHLDLPKEQKPLQ